MSSQTAERLKQELRRKADPRKAAVSRSFFKTGPGEYAEGDTFIGVTVPEVRRIAKAFSALPESGLAGLLASKVHEDRMAALMILVERYRRAGARSERKNLYTFYRGHLDRVNNWDLVDLSAPSVPGPWWMETNGFPEMKKLARANNLWHRRVAMVGTLAFIRAGRFREPLEIADLLLEDPEDLMHKAAGWMLRELGKRDSKVLENYLQGRANRMPRTMLRYAIERFSEQKRQGYLKIKREPA